ncbi:MAG: DUF4410 domain-containing protein [Verrucomicrobiota bacterium]
MRTFKTLIQLFCPVSALILIQGCASVSVEDTLIESNAGGNTLPLVIYVTPLDTTGEFNVDREGAELTEFKENLQDMMDAALNERFNKHLVTTILVSDVSQVPQGRHWLMKGKFTLVNQGSRALRATIGFGAGGTKMETEIEVYDMLKYPSPPFMAFRTTGGSGASPGGLVSAGPVGAVVSGVSGAAKGVTDDVLRTSRMITANLSDFMFKRGWISKSDRLEPKR